MTNLLVPEQCSPYSGKVLVKFNGLLYTGICGECKRFSARLSLLNATLGYNKRIYPSGTICRGLTHAVVAPLCHGSPDDLSATTSFSSCLVSEVYHELAYVKLQLSPANTTGVLQSFVSLAVSGFIADAYGYLILIDLMSILYFIFLLFHVRTFLFGSIS